jgi:hypothetical protein
MYICSFSTIFMNIFTNLNRFSLEILICYRINWGKILMLLSLFGVKTCIVHTCTVTSVPFIFPVLSLHIYGTLFSISPNHVLSSFYCNSGFFFSYVGRFPLLWKLMYLITFLLRFPIRLVVFLFVVSCYPFFSISSVTASCKASPRFLFRNY